MPRPAWGEADELFDDRESDEEIIDTGGYGAEPGALGEIGDHAAAHRHAIGVIVMLQELRLQLRHVDIGRTFGLTSFATEAKVHHFINFFIVVAVGLIAVRQKLP